MQLYKTRGRDLDMEIVRKQLREEILPQIKRITQHVHKASCLTMRNSASLPEIKMKPRHGLCVTMGRMLSEDVTPRDLKGGADLMFESTAAEDQEMREDVRLLESWSTKKICSGTGAAKAQSKDSSKEPSAVTASLVELKGQDPDLLDTYLVEAAREQLRYYKERDSREHSRSPGKPEGGAKSLRLDPRQVKNTETIMRLERELTEEVKRCKLKFELDQRKKELRLLLARNGGLVPKMKEIHVELTSSSKKPRLAKGTTRDDVLNSARSGSKSKKRFEASRTLMLQDQQPRFLEDKKDVERRGQHYQLLALRLEQSKHDYKDNLERIHALEQETAELKPRVKAHTKAQLDYYYGLLREGKDTRNVGLTWIIKAIVSLEGKLPSLLRFPKHIDEETAQMLNKIAALEMKAEAQLKEKRRLCSQLTTSTARSQEFVAAESSPLLTQKEDSKRLRQGRMERHQQKQDIEAQVVACYKTIRELKSEELKRLTKSFIRTDLRKAGPNFDLMLCLTAIFGDTQAEVEAKRILSRRDEMLAHWETYKTFVVVKPPDKGRKSKGVSLVSSQSQQALQDQQCLT